MRSERAQAARAKYVGSKPLTEERTDQLLVDLLDAQEALQTLTTELRAYAERSPTWGPTAEYGAAQLDMTNQDLKSDINVMINRALYRKRTWGRR